MDAVNKGDKHCFVGAGFSNITHFKKWYKKPTLGVNDFGMLNSSAAWNLLVDDLMAASQCGYVTCFKLIKWEFYSIASEEMMEYADMEDNISVSIFNNRGYTMDHIPTIISDNFHVKQPQ
eukprot:15338662-Ditylum_brightwellii.AAC.1